MKIENLSIQNFRGISDAKFENLGSIVIVAGQNGCGKSCTFDAIRLLKSVYGGYQANEWQQWMGEFQISLSSRSDDFLPIFNDPSREIQINCGFRLAKEERQFILDNADELLREKIWKVILPEAYAWGGYRMALFAAQFREREPEVAEAAKRELTALINELSEPLVQGSFRIRPGGLPEIEASDVLSIVFSTFRPQNIGVVDYHGAQRHYGRENVQGINLNLDANEQQRSQSALYNYANKYNNVKGEMAASYVKEILSEQAGVPRDEQSTLTNTLKELFKTFFPDKEFLGPQPTKLGLLSFPVKTGGHQHDLDDLSAGEKEILYGYLRIRNSAPKYSIILLDEPELHLNPRLIRGLPQFYKKNLGLALENQIWLVTHSDALLREVVGRDGYNVFHMLPSRAVAPPENQMRELSAVTDLDLALADLVGDLASYIPGGKVVILEGGGDSDFDKRVVSSLFPELTEKASLISGSNKVRVRSLLDILESAANEGFVPFKFFSITDRDSEPISSPNSGAAMNSFMWDGYHIENYFLDPKYIGRVLSALEIEGAKDENIIWDELRECAKETLPQLVRLEVSGYANTVLVSAINTKADPAAANQADVISEAVERSIERINTVAAEELTIDKLRAVESAVNQKFLANIADGSWVKTFRGREVLKRYVAKYALKVSYEVFRNLILSQMKDDGFRPAGMEEVVQKILSA